MEIFFSVIIGYALGCFSPSAILAKIKNVDLRSQGTNNMGATNATIVFGKGAGAIVMLLDMLKAYFAYEICQALFPSLSCAGLIAGLFAIVGHVFPVTMKFHGGKGLASFAGVVLARNPLHFLALLLACLVLMLLVNYSFVVPFSGAIGFCALESISSASISVFILTFLAGAIIVYKHFGNAMAAFRREDITVREFIKQHLFKHQ